VLKEDLKIKYNALQERFRELGSLAVAYSSGVDSTFLMKVAKDTLGEKAIAITVVSHVFPDREKNEATQFCKAEGIRHEMIEVDEFEIDGFAKNPPNRCYICKKHIFTNILSKAKECGISYVAEGSNMDDLGDYRPGLQAVKELGIISPLREVGLYKSEIRELSKCLGLSTADKPSFACLASRVPYGEVITKEKLKSVEQSEDYLLSKGFHQFRVRVHGDLAHIEVLPEEMDRLLDKDMRAEIVSQLKRYGFMYVTVDLQGYRTGSMNEVLKGGTNGDFTGN